MAQPFCRIFPPCSSAKSRFQIMLAEGYTEEDLIAAALGWVNDPWPERRHNNALAILLRDGGQVEKFRGLHACPAPALPRTGPRSQAAELERKAATTAPCKAGASRWTDSGA